MESAPRVVVIVLNYNGARINDACLASLRAEQDPGMRVLFVDNGSTDGSFEQAQAAFPEFLYQQNGGNLYFAAGNNRGMEAALSMGAEYLFILNNDTVVEPGCIAALLEFMTANPSVAACQPLLCAMHRPEIVASAGCRLGGTGKPWDHACGQPVSVVGADPYPVLAVTGGAMFLRAEAVRSVGLFDETFQMYFEDVDLGLRLRTAGWELCCVPQARVRHIMWGSSDELGPWKRIYFGERNSYLVMLKHYPLARLLRGYALGLPLAVMAAAYHFLRGKPLRAWYIVKAMFLGMANFFKYLPKVWARRKQPCPFAAQVDWKVARPPACDLKKP